MQPAIKKGGLLRVGRAPSLVGGGPCFVIGNARCLVFGKVGVRFLGDVEVFFRKTERLAGGWQLLTTPQYGPVLHRLHTDRQSSRLSQPALESLAIICYRQPIMRAEIEAIRGVASGEVLRGLLERRLVKIVGRAEVLGRPMLYGTTKEFLKVFGLASLDDLPAVKGLAPDDSPARRLAKLAEQQNEPAPDMSTRAAEPSAEQGW